MVDVASPAPGASVEVVTHGQLAWVHVERPTSAELDYLRRRFGLHPAHLAECLSRHQRPRLVEQPDYLLLVLGVPIYNRLARVTASGEVSIFAGSGYVVTLHHGEVRSLVRLFRDCQGGDERRAELMGAGAGYLLYAISDRLTAQCLQAAEALVVSVQAVEEAALADHERDVDPGEVAFLRRDVAALGRIVRPQALALAGLARIDRRPEVLGEDSSAYWGSLADRLGHVVETVDACREAVDGVAAVSSSLAARRTERAVRLLAVVSGVTLPLLLFVAMFGVNVKDLPLAAHPYAFELILGAVVVAAVATLYAFRRARWL